MTSCNQGLNLSIIIKGGREERAREGWVQNGNSPILYPPPPLNPHLDPFWTPFEPPSGPPTGPPTGPPFLLRKRHFLSIGRTLTFTLSLGTFYRPSICSRELHDNVGCPKSERFIHQVICFWGNGPYLPYSWIISARSKA